MKNNTLWEKITSFENLYHAFRAAARSRRSKETVTKFEFSLEEELTTLRAELIEHRYHTGGYCSFYIHDPKRRLISAAPFRDRVVHHALCNVIEPLFEREFIYDSYANRVGKGTHRALDRCTTFLRKYQYVLPIDIVQYFPSIDHQILHNQIAEEIEDQDVLELCWLIIDSARSIPFEDVNNRINHNKEYHGMAQGKGLPIGNLTSQFWANVYLNSIDQKIKRVLKCKGYVRYVDDMLLFADDKHTLWKWLESITQDLTSLGLKIHEFSAQPRPTRSGIPFLGFQVFPDHRRLKHRKLILARKRFGQMMIDYELGLLTPAEVRERTIAWLNHARYGDTWGLRKKMLENIVL